MEQMGVCPETVWKYDDGPDFFKKQPDKAAYDEAQKCKVKGYARVAQAGVAWEVLDSWEGARSWKIARESRDFP